MNSQFEITRKYWGDAIQRGNLIYPNNQVIRFVKRNYREEKNITILDFGCGGGRNTLALLNEGYNVIAMDYTESAIEMTKVKCKNIGIDNVRIIKNIGFDVPLQEDSVDVVIADGSLFYYSKDDIIKMISNLNKVMKTGGLIWTDFRTKKDSLFGRGKKLDNGLYALEYGTGRESCTYFFADEEDIQEIFLVGGFQLVSVDDYLYTEHSHDVINSWFHVIAKK